MISVFSFAMFQSLIKFSLVDIFIWIRKFSLPFEIIIIEFSFIQSAIRKNHLSFSLFFPIFEISLVFDPVFILNFALSRWLIIFPISFENIPISEFLNSFAFSIIFTKLSDELISVGKKVSPISFFQIPFKVPFISISCFTKRVSSIGSFSLIIFPFSSVLITVCKSISSFSLFDSIFKASFIEVIIIVVVTSIAIELVVFPFSEINIFTFVIKYS